ncbi:hypothetical protein BV25DRAFT_352589 [Artomyces pyxidatus]|uniref:Uncharacterized protein n=1 Tax=Artomyces pyxidatus TaxID=48021 RepID=A0ACB8SF17_9AGAM|nr:hypothetical protein BV25DRAFT_352589 [Artomyces pyxidatus]
MQIVSSWRASSTRRKERREHRIRAPAKSRRSGGRRGTGPMSLSMSRTRRNRSRKSAPPRRADWRAEGGLALRRSVAMAGCPSSTNPLARRSRLPLSSRRIAQDDPSLPPLFPPSVLRHAWLSSTAFEALCGGSRLCPEVMTGLPSVCTLAEFLSACGAHPVKLSRVGAWSVVMGTEFSVAFPGIR